MNTKSSSSTTTRKEAVHTRLTTPNKPAPRKFVVKNPELAKHGFLKKFVEKAADMKHFTRDDIVQKAARSKDCTLERGRRYFYYCTRNKIFAPANKKA